MKKPKVILLHRWIPAAVFCVLAAVLMFWVVATPRVVGAAAATRQLPIYCVKRDYKVCSLTFDAAWADVRLRPMLRSSTGALLYNHFPKLSNHSYFSTALRRCL